MNDITVNSLWISAKMDSMQVACIKSFLNLGHKFCLYTYNKISNAPAEAIIKDANEIIDESFVFKDLYNSYATFSDWFRIKLLHDLGGWWVDCDLFCVKKFDFDTPYVFATERIRDRNGVQTQLCNAVIKMPKGSDIGSAILRKASDKIETRTPQSLCWTEIGARLLCKEIINYNLEKHIVKPNVFCPIDFFNYTELIRQKTTQFEEITYGVHLWNKMWEWTNPMLKSKIDYQFLSTKIG